MNAFIDECKYVSVEFLSMAEVRILSELGLFKLGGIPGVGTIKGRWHRILTLLGPQ